MKFPIVVIALSSLFASLDATATGNHGGGHSGDAGVIGKAGVPASISRTITIEMTDGMRFIPAKVNVRSGETVKFVVKNTGQLKHELVLGTAKDLKAHAAMMSKHPDMEHADPNMVTVQPGKSGEIIWQFAKAGTVSFACLQPGHFQAGMKGSVVVD
ncbi:MAG: cupredoxin family protein [Rhodocyclaceae bacterium]|nr:cupredoxin family protein [Rhodocyclaceae bacterium]